MKKSYFNDFTKKRTAYKSPGPIINAPLLRGSAGDFLKSSLVEHHDYEAIPEEVWVYIVRWYNCDRQIVRVICWDNQSEQTYLDLYPVNMATDESEI